MLHVVHVWALFGKQLLRDRGRVPANELAGWLREAQDRHPRALDRILRKYELTKLKHRIHLHKGEPESAIPELARVDQVDLIVRGTVCRTGIKGGVYGNFVPGERAISSGRGAAANRDRIRHMTATDLETHLVCAITVRTNGRVQALSVQVLAGRIVSAHGLAGSYHSVQLAVAGLMETGTGWHMTATDWNRNWRVRSSARPGRIHHRGVLKQLQVPETTVKRILAGWRKRHPSAGPEDSRQRRTVSGRLEEAFGESFWEQS